MSQQRIKISRTFGALVQERRKAREWTRKEVALRAGVTPDFLKALETRGQKTANKRGVEAIMKVLGIEEILAETPKGAPLQLLWIPPRQQTVPLPRALSKALKNARRKQKKSLTQVAEEAQSTFASVHMLELGRVEHVNADLLARTATALAIFPNSSCGSSLQKLGFQWAGEKPPEIDWDQVPLGKKSDCELAQELGVRVSKVQRHRSRRGIPAYQGPRRKYQIELPFTAAQIQAELGDPPVDGEKINWQKTPLGCTSDQEIASWLGCSRERVSYMRRRFGLPRYNPVQWGKVPLGKYPDTIIAKWTGVSTAAVAARRRRDGIPAAPSKTRRDQGGHYSTELRSEFLTPRELRFPTNIPSFPSPSKNARSKTKGSLWDNVEAAAEFIDNRQKVTPEEVISHLELKNSKQNLKEVRQLLGDLGWKSSFSGVWSSDSQATKKPKKPLSEKELQSEIQEVLQTGIWTASLLAKKTDTPTVQVRAVLQNLLENKTIRRVGQGAQTLYFHNPQP